jgi:hypothetical protein
MLKPASRDARQILGSDPAYTPTPCFTGGSDDEAVLAAAAALGTRAHERRQHLRTPGIDSDSCTSFHPGHRGNPRAVRSLMACPTLWAPADIEVVMTVTQGLILHIFAGGTQHQVFSHDIAAINQLLRIAPFRTPGVSLGRVNFHNGAIALPADPRHSAGLRYFSFSTEPLTACIFDRDPELARDFESLTADLQLS